MSYQVYQIVSFGVVNSGLSTVGYTLYDTGNNAQGSRVTSGITSLGSGDFGAYVTYPSSDFQGRITWDTGTSSPLYASADINSIPQQVWSEPISSYLSGSAGYILNSYSSSFTNIPQAVWSQNISTFSSGSAGYILNSTTSSISNIPQTVWSQNVSSFSSGSAGNILNASTTSFANISQNVWSQNISAFSSGTAGYILNSSTSSIGNIAVAVWSEIVSGFPSGSAGSLLNNAGIWRGSPATLIYPVSQTGVVTLIQNTDYYNADGRALSWTDVNNVWPTLTSATINFVTNFTTPQSTISSFTITGFVVVATGSGKQVAVEVPSSYLTTTGVGSYSVTAILSDTHVIELGRGSFYILSLP